MRFIVAAGLVVGTLLQSVPSSSPVRPRITGLSHVAFRVSDAEAARRFYGNVLGLAERRRPNRTISYVVGAHQSVVLEPGLPAEEEERLSHLAFETTDVRALQTYLASRGVQVVQPPGRCEESAIRVSDPDGHEIEFVQVEWPPPAAAKQGNAVSTRLLHAGITVRDEQAAHRFYRDVLGFSEIWRGGRTEGTTDWVNMRTPDGTDYVEYMLVTTPPDRRQRGVLHHLCLLVPEIQVAWETVAARSGEATRSQLTPPSVGRNGRWQLNLYDPDGTRTELMEPFRIR
jgi:catechol 2,3-dioxygenase-like lactoylglutathione lyase family enzyme